MCITYENEVVCQKCGFVVNFQMNEVKCKSGRADCPKRTIKGQTKVNESGCLKCQEERYKKKRKRSE